MDDTETRLHRLRMWISERSGVGGWSLDLKTEQLVWTDQTKAIHGVDADYVPSLDSALDFYPQEARAQVRRAIDHALTSGEPWELELPFVNRRGEHIWVRAKGEAIFDKGRPTMLIGSFQDITETVERRQQLEQAQASAEESKTRLWLAIEALPEAFVLYDQNDQAVIFNSQYRDLYRESSEAIQLGATFEDILRAGLSNKQYPEAIGREEEWLKERLARHRNPAGPITQELPGDRHLQIHEVLLSSGDVVGFRVDVTQLKRQQRELKEKAEDLETAAVTDPLTELGNRRALDLHVQRLRAVASPAARFGLLHVDLDRFKPINDVFGHAAGDYLLTEVSKMLKAGVKNTDFVARVGGDEFVVVLSLPDGAVEAAGVAERIIEMCRRPLAWQGKKLLFGASVGIAVGSADELNQMLNDADIALYEAKNSGRNRHHVFNADLRRRVEERKRLSDDLFLAVERKEITAYYQPQFRSCDLSLCGVEALARWEHPLRGVMTPHQFLDLADEIGLLTEIDRLVCEHAIETGFELVHRQTPSPKVSVNLDLERLIRSQSNTWFPRARELPFQLSIEILESLDVDKNLEAVSWRIDKIKELGLQIEVDDFGSGHASLTSLLKIRPHRVKLDLGLVHASRTDPEGAGKMVQAICKMCIDLGIKVTAEGIETENDARAMTQLGCDTLQGFLYSRPLSRADLFRFAASRLHLPSADRAVG